MHLHDLFFYGAVFFILGVMVSSLAIPLPIIVLSTACSAVLLFFIIHTYGARNLFSFAILSFFVIAGAVYFSVWNFYHTSSVVIPFSKSIRVEGVITREPERGDTQQFVVTLNNPYSGAILVRADRYPEYHYGDLLSLAGVIRTPTPLSYAQFLSKDGVFGIMNSPSIEFIEPGHGSSVKTFLFRVKARVVDVFHATFLPHEAAFIAGITLGERAEFSKEFKDQMSRSGTTHLVALSGYNISILVLAMFSLFRYFFSSVITFWCTVLAVIGFVIMTGAEASVVRAAIMGCIILLAAHLGRVRSMRNAITAAALVMVIANPAVLRFDIGFQLSFAALLGIVYLMPAIRTLFNIQSDFSLSLFNWRDHLLTTIAAQLAVIPLLLLYFQNFSLSSFLANVLILEVIPLTMFLGFLIGILGFIAMPLAALFGWFTHILLSYELGVISFFSTFSLPVFTISFFGSVVYYLLVILFIIEQRRRSSLRAAV